MQPDSRLDSVSDDLLRDPRLSSSCAYHDSRLNLVLDEFLRDSRFSSSCVLPDARLDSVLMNFRVTLDLLVDPYLNGSSDLTVTRVGHARISAFSKFHRPTFQIFLRSCKCRD